MTEARTTPVTLSARPDMHFDFSGAPAIHHQGNIYLSHFWNALSLMAPTTERGVIRAMRNVRKAIQDPRLRADLDALLGQEGLHTRQHRRFNDHLATLGYDPRDAVERADRELDSYLNRVDSRAALALAIAGEHVIYVLSHLLLMDERVCEGMDPEVRRLFEWHALEEIEHQSVAHDVYVHLFGDGPRHRWQHAKALKDALEMLGRVGSAIFGSLVRSEPQQDAKQLAAFVRFMVLTPGYGRVALAGVLRFLQPDFQPWKNSADLPMVEATLVKLQAASA